MDNVVELQTVGLVWRYSVVVFAAVLGIIQVASAHAGLCGLLFILCKARVRLWPSHYYWTITPLYFSYLFAVITVVPSLAYLFMWNSYNEVGIIEGSEQAGLFVLSTLAAGLFSLFLSSIINHWQLRHNRTQAQGIEALKEITWFQAFWRRWVRRAE
ncbi:MAG: hypothetical protein FWC25_01565 [Dehalococcoidia bacterium]|nr:hypothetical protein [Dehalococcoidia bacterium]